MPALLNHMVESKSGPSHVSQIFWTYFFLCFLCCYYSVVFMLLLFSFHFCITHLHHFLFLLLMWETFPVAINLSILIPPHMVHHCYACAVRPQKPRQFLAALQLVWTLPSDCQCLGITQIPPALKKNDWALLTEVNLAVPSPHPHPATNTLPHKPNTVTQNCPLLSGQMTNLTSNLSCPEKQ